MSALPLTPFGFRCRELRHRTNLRLGDQAAALGMSVAAICSIETGSTDAPVGYVQKVATYYSLSVDDALTLRQLAGRRLSRSSIPGLSADRTKFYSRALLQLNKFSPGLVRGLRKYLTEGARHAEGRSSN